jgi:predicted Zn-ribbon and HTH transcriptional regulator
MRLSGCRRADARIGLKLLLQPGRCAFCGSDDKEIDVLTRIAKIL